MISRRQYRLRSTRTDRLSCLRGQEAAGEAWWSSKSSAAYQAPELPAPRHSDARYDHKYGVPSNFLVTCGPVGA
jgi:hypothetical protein